MGVSDLRPVSFPDTQQVLGKPGVARVMLMLCEAFVRTL